MLDVISLDLLMSGYDFPKENIKNNWYANMEHFVNNFKKLKFDEVETEKFILYQIDDIWMQGYIDLIAKSGNKTILLDWKTSSMFRGKGLVKAGRQLAIYQDALKQIYDINIDINGWYMIKYLELQYKGRRKTLQRKDLVSDSIYKIEAALKNESEITKQAYIDEALKVNSLSVLPQYAQEQFKIFPHIKQHDVTDEVVNEARQYIIDTVDKINNEVDFQPCDISKNDFFCNNLCNHRNTCEYLARYNKGR